VEPRFLLPDRSLDAGIAVARAGKQAGLRRTQDAPTSWNRRARADREPAPRKGRDLANGCDGEADRRTAECVRRLEGESITDFDVRDRVQEQLTALVAHDFADGESAIVGLRARHVLASFTAAIHTGREAAAVNLHERFDLGGRRRSR